MSTYFKGECCNFKKGNQGYPHNKGGIYRGSTTHLVKTLLSSVANYFIYIFYYKNKSAFRAKRSLFQSSFKDYFKLP